MKSISPHFLALAPETPLLTGDGSGEVGRKTRMPPVRRMLRMAVRWRWVLIGGAALGALAGLALTFAMTRQYSATVRLEIARETPRVTNIESVERDAGFANQEFYQTQYGLLQTKLLAERVARDLKLVDSSAFFRMFGRKDLSSVGDGPADPAERAHRNEIAGKLLLDHVDVTPVRGSSLVDITAVTPDPELSQRIAQTWAQDFIANNLERRFDASAFARRFLENRLDQLRDRLQRSERQAVSYAEQQGIIDLPSESDDRENGGTAGSRSLVTDDLATLNRALQTATAERIQAQSLLPQARRPEASIQALDSQTIGNLRGKRAEAAADYARLMTQFEPSYPLVKAAASQVQTLDTAIGLEEGRVRTSFEQIYDSAVRREQGLSTQVGKLKAGFTELQRRSIQYNIFRRDADTNRQLYNGLLQRYKEIGVAGGIDDNNVQIADSAKLPDHPSSPRLLVNLILATLAGSMLAIVLAAMLEQIDEGIGDPSEIQEKFGLPLLGAIPRVTGDDPLVALDRPHSALVEAYLAVQANLQLSTSHGMPRSLAIISTRPREGKSTTAIALAQSLARAHRRVVLVDADMRSPSIHSAFGIANTAGVSNFLAGSDSLDSLRGTKHESLSILPAGPQPPNAAELLSGTRLKLLVERLLEQFDHVIVDSPPVIGLADAPLVAAAVQSVVYAVEARSIQAGTVRVALDRLRTAQANVIGAVLTKFEAKRSTLGYDYDYGYGYGKEQ
jgi:succinoglycan biosynthesis transport protein ExoP